MDLIKVKTPCVGICSTVFGDHVCRGCRRFIHEVIDWNHYTSQQKLLVWERLEKLLDQVLVGKLKVTEENELLAQIKIHRIQCPEHFNTRCKAFYVLKEIHKSMTSLQQSEEFGFKLIGLNASSPIEAYENLAQHYFELSSAHYDASIARKLFVQQDN